jgi:hypothetical protein
VRAFVHVRLRVPASVLLTMRPIAFPFRRPIDRVAVVCAGLLLAGCAANQTSTPTLLDKLLATSVSAPEEAAPAAQAAPAVQKEGCGTAPQCKAALKKLVDSPKRGWVGQQQAPAAYTDGTRLFAYRALRGKLTCEELTLALAEVRAASKSLAGEVPGASPEQISRTRALSSQVEGELSKERGARCKS